VLKFETQSSLHFDELTSIQAAWDFRVAQLGPVTKESTATLYETEHVRYNEFRFKSAYEQRLHTRSGYLSFGLMLPDSPETWVGDVVLPSDGLVVFPTTDDIKASSPVGFGADGMHFSAAFLESLAEAVYCKPLAMKIPPPGVYRLDPQKLHTIRAELLKWQQLAQLGTAARASIVARREETLSLAILDSLDAAALLPQTDPRSSERVINKALEIIHGSDMDNIGIAELCIHVGCTPRALEKSFTHRFGVPPKRYIKCWRLARIRQGLLHFHAQDCESIIELAGIQGFWHMGQFAADYRRIYGELPSDTLKRAGLVGP
jgi:AraC family ethanolamine operon transcriptional activator